MINRFWPKPPEAEGDMQIDIDAARPEQYSGNRFASVQVDEEDEEEDDEEVEEEDDDKESEKVRSPHSVRSPIAPTLPHVSARSV